MIDFIISCLYLNEAPAQFLLIILALEETYEIIQWNHLLYIGEKPETWKGK